MVDATPRHIADGSACDFYHSIDLPSGSHEGAWDLRGRFDDYTGRVPLAGKTVLDVGTASGFLTFEAERRGAIVTSFDAADAGQMFELPIVGGQFSSDYTSWLARAEASLERMKNSYWLSHRELGSSARCLYGDIYDFAALPEVFEVVLIGQVLIHLRDGLSALAAAASACTETLVVTEGSFAEPTPLAALSGRADRPDIGYAWYQYSHGWYREVLAMLGFRDVAITTDTYVCNHALHEHEIELATVVASRLS